MKKSISNRINMYVVILETCRRHEEEWAGIPKLVSAVNDFEAALNELNAIALLHATKTIGVSSYKTQKLANLYENLEAVHSAFRALAIETNDVGLHLRNSISVSRIRKMDAVKLKTHMARVAEDLIVQGSELEAYGFDNVRTGEVLQLIEESTAIISKPRGAIVERKSLTTNMDLKADAIDTIVKERIDNMVRLMKRSLPDFFNEYFAARKVISTGVRHNNPTDGFNSSAFGTVPSEPDDGN
jgi:hypothetical protein